MKRHIFYFLLLWTSFFVMTEVYAKPEHPDATDIYMENTKAMSIGRCTGKSKEPTPEDYISGGDSKCKPNEIFMGIQYKNDGTPDKILCGNADQCIGPGKPVNIGR